MTIYSRVAVSVSSKYYDNKELCKCEVNRRRDIIHDFLENLPVCKKTKRCYDVLPTYNNRHFAKLSQKHIKSIVAYIKEHEHLQEFVEIKIYFL